MASLDEISEAFYTAKKFGSKDITLLYCVSNYPSKINDFNLNNIKILEKKFNCRVGLSDHSNNNIVAKTAVALGAKVIEKHIALENQKTGPDIEFSLKGKEIKKFIEEINSVEHLKGKNRFFRTNEEQKNRSQRRSIFASNNIVKGQRFTFSNIKKIRPGIGIDPKYYLKLINKKSPKNFLKAEPLTKDILKKLNLIKK